MSESPLIERACPVCQSDDWQSHWRKGELSKHSHATSLSSPKGGEGRGEEARYFQTQIPSPQPSPRLGGERGTDRMLESACLQIVRCKSCGMVYVNPVLAAMASGQFYDTEGADYYLSPAKLASDYADVRFERELRLLRQFCPRGSVLDVGCGSGGFLFQLKKRWPNDYQILGTDVSGGPLDYGESQGVPVVRGDFLRSAELQLRAKEGREQAELELRAPFDAVTLWAVAEHLAEPKRFLEKAYRLLKPGGLCFVLVPNLRSLAVRLLGAKYRYVYAQHLNYFSAATLGRLGTRAGFEVAATRFTHFNPVVIWQDWRGRGREVSNAERGELLKQTTALKQKPWLKPVKWLYGLTEQMLGAVGLADNVVVVFRKT